MIAKITSGWRVGGLLEYLMGPGRFNEHVDPRVVASWDAAPARHQPPTHPDGTLMVRDLAAALADPATAAGVAQVEPGHEPGRKPRRGPVWHCSLRNHADDRVLTDAEWEQVVTDLMHRTGIARRGDLGACRWVAVRHAADHVHVAAVLVRQDNGRRVHPRFDRRRAREVCVDAEQALGITRTAAADRTAVAPATRAELEKASRRGRQEPSREWLRRAVRVAAVQVHEPDRFFARLVELGVQVRPKTGREGQLVGYAVADPDPGMTTAVGDAPVWFSGRRLGSDLSLPQLLARWASAPAPPTPIPAAPTEHSAVGRAEREAALAGAIAVIERATAAVADGGEDAVGIAHSTADLTVAMRAVLTRTPAAAVSERAERLYDRAARQTRVGQPRVWGPMAAQLRTAAWRLAAVRSVSGARNKGDAAAVVQLIVAVTALIAEIAAYHEQRRCSAQAAAARDAARVWRQHRTGPGPGMAGRTPEVMSGPGSRPSPMRDDRPARAAGTPAATAPPGRRTPQQPRRRGRPL